MGRKLLSANYERRSGGRLRSHSEGDRWFLYFYFVRAIDTTIVERWGLYLDRADEYYVNGVMFNTD